MEITDKKIDFQKICRICGTATDCLTSVLETNVNNLYLVDIINKYLMIKVNRFDDTLPHKACSNCVRILLDFHDLFKKCSDVNHRFQENLKNSLTAPANYQNEIDLLKTMPIKKTPVNKVNQTEKFHIIDKEICSKRNSLLQNESKNQRKQQCKFCIKQFTSKKILRDHLKDLHSDLIFHCDICGEYESQNILKIHMTEHAILIEKQQFKEKKQIQHNIKKFKCDKCDKTFTENKNKQYHMDHVHLKIKNYKCDICDKQFGLQRLLNDHTQACHDKLKPFSCEKCQKSFSTKQGLFAHNRTHENTYYFRCEICYKVFKFAAQLKRHLLIHVESEKLHHCSFCKKSFRTKSNLGIHMKVHTNLLDFKCHLCSFVTKQCRYLAEHMKRIHHTIIKKTT